MNKKLLMLVFATLVVTLTSFGQQNDRAVLADGSLWVNDAQSVSSQYVPIFGNRANKLVQSQVVLPRESLTRMLYGEIKRMAFYTQDLDVEWPGARFDVYLAEVGFTDFEAGFYDWNNMSLVYSGPLSVVECDTVTGIMSFDLDNYFTYEGGDLLIGINQTVAGTKKSVAFLGVSHDGHNTSIYTFGSAPAPYYYEEFLPMTRFTYIKHGSPSCIRPREITLTNCGADNAEINWISGEGQTAWQLVYSTDGSFDPNNATPIDVSNHPFVLSGLDPETEYHVYVRANCGDGNSEWSDKFSFTTTATCVTPSNLQLISQNGISAELGWTGENPNYTLRYRDNANVGGEILLSSDFENGLPSGWSVIDHDGDYHGWSHDNGGYVSFDGNGSMYSLSYYNLQFLQADDWLITPMVGLGGTVTFYAKGRPHYSLSSSEHFAVYVSTTNPPTVNNFIQISPEYITTSDYALYSVDLSGYQGETGYIAIRHFNSWNTACICIDNFTVYSEPASWIEVEGIDSNTYTLMGLSQQSYYEAQVMAVCSAEDASGWSESLLFNTKANSANYVVDAEHPFFEGFESSTFPPAYWSAPINSSINMSWSQFVSGASIGDYGHDGYHKGFCSANSDMYGPVELVMPEIHIAGNVGNQVTLSFWSYFSKWLGEGSISVKISTNHGSSFSTLWSLNSPSNSYNMTWVPKTVFLDNYINKDVIIKFILNSDQSFKWFLDDVSITVSYDKEFTTAGNWNVASNWTPSGVPTSNQSVLISKAATIPSGCVAEAKSIKIGNGSLTIADGGQLKHNNKGVNAIAKKTITGYGSGAGHWYLIATPVERSHYPSNVTNLISTGTNYDLYRFDQNSGIEWKNYKQGEITYIDNSIGYLYANSDANTINFVGELMPSQSPITVALDWRSDHQYESTGWNLIGNPFACNAYLLGNTNFYRMNDNGTGLILANGAIAPCEGVFVKATAPGQSATFTRTAPVGSGNQLDFNLSDVNGQMIDRARIYLNSTQTTDKFSLFANSTKLYISNEGRDYAAFGTESSGEIPVNFKSSEDGKYCISLDSDVNMSYLHLIDNLTGADVDLRKTPTYSFTSKTTDYASRFKVVFMAESDGNQDSFAFVNNGKLIVLDSDHEATLQVIDMTGRILSSERISGSCMMPLNYTPGVYVLRLIEGNEVRTQKIVLGRN